MLARRSGAAGGERARARESGGAARRLLGAVLGSCGSGGRGGGGQRRPSLDGTRVNDLSPLEFLNYDFDAVINTHYPREVPY